MWAAQFMVVPDIATVNVASLSIQPDLAVNQSNAAGGLAPTLRTRTKEIVDSIARRWGDD